MAFGKEVTADRVRELQSKMKSGDTLSVDMVQTSFTALRNKTTVRTGKAVFTTPSKFKWMLETPIQEYKIYDGKYFYDYAPGTKSANRYSPMGPSTDDLKGIVDLILNFDTLLKRYDLVKADETADEVKIELKPKTSSDINGVELRLSIKDSYITYVRMDLKGKNTLTHEFSHPSRKAVPASTFELPVGVKVTESN